MATSPIYFLFFEFILCFWSFLVFLLILPPLNYFLKVLYFLCRTQQLVIPTLGRLVACGYWSLCTQHRGHRAKVSRQPHQRLTYAPELLASLVGALLLTSRCNSNYLFKFQEWGRRLEADIAAKVQDVSRFGKCLQTYVICQWEHEVITRTFSHMTQRFWVG